MNNFELKSLCNRYYAICTRFIFKFELETDLNI